MKQQDILKFWRDIEIFNMPDLGNAKPLKLEELPWKNPEPLSNENYKLTYTLYFGKLDKQSVIETIEEVMSLTPREEFMEHVDGQTWLSALILDDEGRPDDQSYVQPSYTHGLKCHLEGEHSGMVSKSLESVKQDFEGRYQIPPFELDEKGKPKPRKGPEVISTVIKEECEHLRDKFGGWYKGPIEVFYSCFALYKDEVSDPSHLNSFYLKDLNLLSGMESSEYSLPLSQYLNLTVDHESRVDLINDKEAFIKSLYPKNMPLGRWPSDLNYGLYTAQLGAVNTIVSGLSLSGGLRGVNGPPGTGKTTMLKEVIAHVIVTRAIKICSHDSQLFTKAEKDDLETGTIYMAKKAVMGDSGIVVASSNNNAVENISKELPVRSKLDKSYIKDGQHVSTKSQDNFLADYFSDLSQKFAPESWGIISAPLGKAEKKKEFIVNFLKGKGGFIDYLKQVGNEHKGKPVNPLLKKLEKSIKEFKTLKSKIEEFLNEASFFHCQLGGQLKAIKELEALRHVLNVSEKKILDTESVIVQQEQKVADWDNATAQVRVSLELHNKTKPLFFFIKKILGTKDYLAWNVPFQNSLEQMQQTVTKRTEEFKKLQDFKDKLNLLQEGKRKHIFSIETIQQKITEYEKLKEQLIIKYDIPSGALVDESFYHKELNEIHLINPYKSTKVNRLRSDLFLKALEIHKYSIEINAFAFATNLDLFVKMINRSWKPSAKETKSLWDTLFFCVPVISTTTASASNLFNGLGREDIGWLLIDEAGQATPQSVVGSLWRSRRSVIVGDPLQIEPVVTIPKTLVKNLMIDNKVTAEWSPTNVSVQMLADRVCKLGTYMKMSDDDEVVWTGYPLRSHRRCIEPMFGISNRLSYQNQMVMAPSKDELPHLPPSQWFDVQGLEVVDKHIVLKEIDMLDELIKTVRKTYNDFIYVISPFKAIGEHCQKKYPIKISVKGKMVDSGHKVECGTVHKFQGKEAHVVVFVLGTYPDGKGHGARNWASEKPNLLNVAFTRAKTRIYVIGSKEIWSEYRYFDEMSERIAQLQQLA